MSFQTRPRWSEPAETARPALPRSEAALAASDMAACRRLIRHGSKSFYAASLLLPKDVREPASALYAFCRLSDDAVDVDHGAAAGLAALRDRLERIYAGRPVDIAADRALMRTVAEFGLPRALLEALIEGFAWDVEGRRYRDFEALTAYGARVAGAVGALMAVLMGATERRLVARAADLGVAMQLTNIARDVGEDARNGRIYLPLDWLEAAGVDPDAFLAAPRHSPALGAVVSRLLGEADRLYRRSESGIARLPAGCRPAIFAARLLYAEIGHEVARRGHDSVAARAVTPLWRKAAILAQSVTTPLAVRPSDLDAPPLAETRFLVDAAAGAGRRAPRAELARATGLVAAFRAADDRLGRVIELLDRLERRDAELERSGPEPLDRRLDRNPGFGP